MLKRYNYRAYPSVEQVETFSRAFGCSRWVYNMGIEMKESHYKETGTTLSDNKLSLMLPVLKKQPDTTWLADVPAIVLQQSLRDLAKAYNNFFNGIRDKKQVGKPQYKRRNSKQTFRIVGSKDFTVKKINKRWGTVKLPKMGKLKFRLSRELPNIPSSVTVILESDGTYHVSFVVEVVPSSNHMPIYREAGLDLGLNDFVAVVYSDGTREKIDNPRYSRTKQEKLVKAQKDLARKKAGSSNRRKARIRVAKHHSYVRRQRLNFLHIISSRLVNENQVIVTEDLSIKGLARAGGRTSQARGMRRSIHDAAWGAFLTLLSQKMLEQEKTHLRVDRFFPSTKLCSLCGTISRKKDLSVRSWSCDCEPNIILDRDYNAAVNLLVAGGHSAYGEDIRRALASR